MNPSRIYILMQEFIEIEKQKLWPTEKTLNANIEDLCAKLRELSGRDFSCDLEIWIDWFIGNSKFNEGEKKSLKVAHRVLKIEMSSISKLKTNGMLK